MAVIDEENDLRRFVHWGPILVLIITTIVSLSTWKLWPPDVSFTNYAHFLLFVLLNLLAIYNFVLTVLVGPGLLPKNWQPVHYREARFLQYCKQCAGYKAPRAHHCRRCDRCVKKMDHHCPWTNCCVGWSNQANFVYFLFFYMLSNVHAAVVLCCAGYRFLFTTYYRPHQRRPVRVDQLLRLHFISISVSMLSFGLAVGVVFCMLKMLFIQISGILKNQTDIEYWILKKAFARRFLGKLKPFVYPYDLGWYANLGQVFNVQSKMRSKGIDWPVRKGCDQYALTCEQLAQKADKRNRTRTYKCISPFTGHWLPIWSQGLLVTICFPCTDDPRICLQPNDLISVTRIRNHWLFGERVLSEHSNKDQRKGAIRGWFPSRCAIDITKTAGETKVRSEFSGEGGDLRRIGKFKLSKRNQD